MTPPHARLPGESLVQLGPVEQVSDRVHPEFMQGSIIPKHDDGMFTSEERLLKRLGNANWRAFQALRFRLDRIVAAAAAWKRQLVGIEYPWLIWCIDDDWSYVQQQLVHSVGWTPVVGYDPRNGVPTHLLPGAILVDFNAGLELPVLYMHFPIDFIFLFAPRLAFWHSDLLCTRANMVYLDTLFRSLRQGEIAITGPREKRLVNAVTFWRGSQRRFWELAGCITSEASEHIFDRGCSLWQGWAFHPNCPDIGEFHRRLRWYWDHGTGLRYWHERYDGPVKVIPEARLAAGHCTRIGNPDFVIVTPMTEDRNSGIDLRRNGTVWEVAQRLDILGQLTK